MRALLRHTIEYTLCFRSKRYIACTLPRKGLGHGPSSPPRVNPRFRPVLGGGVAATLPEFRAGFCLPPWGVVASHRGYTVTKVSGCPLGKHFEKPRITFQPVRNSRGTQAGMRVHESGHPCIDLEVEELIVTSACTQH